MNYSGIKPFSIENGEGVRVSLFVSGCRNACKGCFQPETWDFAYGQAFTEQTEAELLELLRPDYVKGLTLLGGDPFEEENQSALLPFLRTVRAQYPQKDIWAYTGYVVDLDLVPDGRKYTSATEEMLSLLDVVVDGPFVQEKKDLTLKFRGSSNQRVIDLKKSREQGELVLLMK